MKLINNKVYFAVQDYLMILLGTLLYGFGFRLHRFRFRFPYGSP